MRGAALTLVTSAAVLVAAACSSAAPATTSTPGLTATEQQFVASVGATGTAPQALVQAGYDACTSLNSDAQNLEAAVLAAKQGGGLDDSTARAVVRTAADTLCPAASVVGLSPTPPPATATATAAPVAAKQVHTGQGNDVVTLATPVQVGILEFKCPKCTDTVMVKSDADIDADLVNRYSGRGPYSGKRWMGMRGGTVTRLQITAQGAWSLTVGGLDMARQLDTTSPTSGSGDDVMLYRSAPSTMAVNHRGESNFTVWLMTDALSSPDLAVNEIGGYDGTVMLPAGGVATLVQVQADGKWTLSPNA